MTRSWTILASLALSGCIVVPVPVPLGVAAVKPAEVGRVLAPPAGPEGDVVRQVNAVRQQRGLPPLSWSDRLADASRSHAAELAPTGQLSHYGLDGASLRTRARQAGYPLCYGAENLALNLPDAAATVQAWVASPDHLVNMENRNVREAGAAVATGAGGRVWAVIFASEC